MVDRVEPGGATNAAYQISRLRLRFASRTSTDWNWRNGDDWRCRSRHTRGPSSLHARCDAALFRIRFGRVANDKVHDGQAGTVESSMPRRDGAQGLPPRLSALRILHAWSLPLLRRGSYRRPSMRRVDDCRPATISLNIIARLVQWRCRAIAPKRTWRLAGFYLAKLGRAPATAGWAVAERRRAKPRRTGTPSCFSAHRGRPK